MYMKFFGFKGLCEKGFLQECMGKKEFNVIAVTKHSLDDAGNYIEQYFLPSGCHPQSLLSGELPDPIEISVKQILCTRSDIIFTKTVVSYQNKEYLLEGVRNGIGGLSLAIGIFNQEEKGYDVWYLHTDTPSARPDCPGALVTSKNLRDYAELLLCHKSKKR